MALALKRTLAAAGALALVPVAAVSVGGFLFRRKVKGDVRRMFTNDYTVPSSSGLALDTAPEPVRRYFAYAFPGGPRSISRVRLTQEGAIRLKENRPGAPFSAEQHFHAARPAFVWHARARLAPLVWIDARDRYDRGKGNMLIRLWSTITLADASGPEMDISSLLRWLSEAPWFPAGLLPSSFLSWEPVDANSARAVIRDGALSASGVFHFNERGGIDRMTTDDRYREENGTFARTPWTIRCWDYRERDGMRIPLQGSAEWNYPDRNLEYIRLRITDIQYE